MERMVAIVIKVLLDALPDSICLLGEAGHRGLLNHWLLQSARDRSWLVKAYLDILLPDRCGIAVAFKVIFEVGIFSYVIEFVLALANRGRLYTRLLSNRFTGRITLGAWATAGGSLRDRLLNRLFNDT